MPVRFLDEEPTQPTEGPWTKYQQQKPSVTARPNGVGESSSPTIEVELPDGRIVGVETDDPKVAAKAAHKFMLKSGTNASTETEGPWTKYQQAQPSQRCRRTLPRRRRSSTGLFAKL